MSHYKFALGTLALSQLTAGLELSSTTQLGVGENICHAAIERNKSFALDYYDLINLTNGEGMFTD
jgi:hypothetical protein